ncbi:flagella basal body P-ring formation protein FlgA [Roseateles noduli]|nr:flagella basal body P-ring formation protein FlgA [Roseateles noduli]
MKTLAAVGLSTVLATVAASSWAGPTPSWRAELRSRADVDGPRVHLGDIVRLQGEDAAAIRAAESLDLGAAPRLGDVLRLERARVDAWLRRAAPRVPALAWDGAEAVSISRAGQLVPADEVCRAAGDALAAALARPDLTVRTSVECPGAAEGRPRLEGGESDGWLVPRSRQLDLKARPDVDGGWPARRVAVPVELWTDGRHARTVTVPVKVELLGRAWVARDDVAARQTLTGDALDAVELDLAGQPTAPVATDAALDRLRLRRPLLKGQVLTAAHVETLPAVLRGQQVTVRSRAGAISLETIGEALQDGVPGKPVLIRMGSRAGGPLLARVVGPNQVQLQP